MWWFQRRLDMESIKTLGCVFPSLPMPGRGTIEVSYHPRVFTEWMVVCTAYWMNGSSVLSSSTEHLRHLVMLMKPKEFLRWENCCYLGRFDSMRVLIM